MNLRNLIDSLWQKHHLEGITIHPPARSADIRRAESLLGFRLPEDFREFYSICNGFETAEDMFHFLGVTELAEKDQYGKDWVIFAEYMIYCDTWTIKTLPENSYLICHDRELALSNSLAVFLEILLHGHVFEPGGLYDWRDAVKNKNSR